MWGTSPWVGQLRPVKATAGELPVVLPVCTGVDLALQGVHSSTNGFSVSVAVCLWVQFNVSGEQNEGGDDCRKGVPPKRKKRQWKLLPRAGQEGPACGVRAWAITFVPLGGELSELPRRGCKRDPMLLLLVV